MRFSNLLKGVSVAAVMIAAPARADALDDQAAAPAQGVTSEPAAPRSAPSRDGGIQDIVVTARRVSESVQKVPLAITVVGAEDLADASVRGIRDLQGLAPALFISTGNGGPSAANIAIRGQTQADTLLVTDPSVAVYLNEINLPRQIGLRSAFLDVEQVQVLKGPQGTLFGKNTTGGALLLRTKRPDLSEAGGFAQGVAGNLGTLQLSGAVSAPVIDGKLGVRLAGQVSSKDGYGRNGIGQKLGDQYDRSARLSVLAQPTDSLSVFLTADYTKSTSNGSLATVTRVNPLAFDATGTPINFLANPLRQVLAQLGLPRTPANYTTAYNQFVAQTVGRPDLHRTNGVERVFAYLELYGFSGDVSLELGDITLRSITGYRATDRNDQQDYDQSPFQIVRPRNFVKSHQFTQELQVLGKLGPIDLIAGGFYSSEKGNEGGVAKQLGLISASSPSSTDYDARNKSYAGFVQANVAITDELKLTGGFRYSKVTQDADIRNRAANGCSVPVIVRPDPAVCFAPFSLSSKKPSYLVSLDYQATPDILLYAKTSSSFRGGGINARGGSSTGPNPYVPFAPEVATDYEVGFKGDLFNRRARLNIAAYYTDYTDIQKSSLTVVNNTLLTVISNAARGKIYGGEVELTVRPVDALTLEASGAWTHARYKEFREANGNDRSKEPFPVPEWQYTVSGKYAVPIGDDELSLFAAWRWQDDISFRGQALDQASTSQKAYGLLEGRISYQLSDAPGVEVALFGKNLLDKTYRSNALDFDGSLGYNLAFIGEPRTYGLEMKILFGGG